MGFRYDTRHLTGQQQAIIRINDENNERLKKESEKDKEEVVENEELVDNNE